MDRTPRGRLLQAARTALADGEKVTLDVAAERARVPRSTAYRIFGSRAALLAELELEPEPSTTERILAAAYDLIGREGLDGLVMDEVASRAEVSRANLYRLFPGKQALFTALMRRYAPLDVVSDVFERHAGEPCSLVMPELARAVMDALQGRVGLIRMLLGEVGKLSPDAAEGSEYVLSRGVARIVAYLEEQMSAGAIRRTNPGVATNAFIAPLLVYLLTRPLTEHQLGLELEPREVAAELAEIWLRGMRPD